MEQIYKLNATHVLKHGVKNPDMLLLYGIYNQQPEIVSKALENGARPSWSESDVAESPLYAACWVPNPTGVSKTIMLMLLDHGAKDEYFTKNTRKNAFIEMCRNFNDTELVDRFMALEETNMYYRDLLNVSVYDYAKFEKNSKICKHLMQKYNYEAKECPTQVTFGPEKPLWKERVSLIQNVSSNQLDDVAITLTKYPHIQKDWAWTPDTKLYSPILTAVKYLKGDERYNMCKLLLKHGAQDVDYDEKLECCAFKLLVEKDEKCLELFNINREYELHWRNMDKKSPYEILQYEK